jgi:hypothetical protein
MVSGNARGLRDAQPSARLLAGLPESVRTDAIQPRNAAAYDSPPPRFQLAEDEVKPLIMGTQLYGDRMLAIRELYQNALDACRLRNARQRFYALTSGKEAQQLKDFTVTFRQDRDSDGRLYIECEDDGIGMTAEELKNLFARAGRRYEQSSTRIRELRRWRRQEIDPELNSRFGIGVFSYFMLADEIQVITRPSNESGHAAKGPAHRVDIVAGSGLMHITSDDADIARGGTRIRLYLRPEEDEKQLPSVLQSLRGFLWHSDVTVQAVEAHDGRTRTVRQAAERRAWRVVGRGSGGPARRRNSRGTRARPPRIRDRSPGQAPAAAQRRPQSQSVLPRIGGDR